MSNIQLWLKTLDDVAAIVDSARHSIPMDDLFQDEEMYEPMRRSISHFDLAAWLMFDTEENRATTTQLIGEFWRHIHKMRSVEPYLERIYESYIGIYRVNYKSEEGPYVQSILFPEPAVVLRTSESTETLKEGDVFLGRIIHTSVGEFLFHAPQVVEEDLRESFCTVVDELKKRQPMIEEKSEAYKATLKKGNPEVLFLYAIALGQAREAVRENLSVELEEDDFFDTESADGILALVPQFAEDEETIISDMYLLEQMESKVMMADGLTLEDNRFTNYDKLMDAASENGDFADDAQMARIYELLHYWCVRQKNDAAREKLEPAREKIPAYKRLLTRSVHGMYRLGSLEDARGEMTSPSRWLEQFDRYLEAVEEEDLVLTKTGAINQWSLAYMLKRVPVFIQTSKAHRESSYPELVFFRKFAHLKGMLVEEEGILTPTVNLEKYLPLDDEKKAVLWVSTLLNENLNKADPYFQSWPFREIFATALAPGAANKHIVGGTGDGREEQIRWRIRELGRDLDLYQIALHPPEDYEFFLTTFGEAAFGYMGLVKKNNVIPLFE
ncbi:MAG: hypothetical protein SOW18_06105 [Peptoniphilus sp.]|nr:hypothetical protein [Peptoniphilus sp.]MDY3119091.1 hypothetical protein [Peptoniphilus sp.]